jgi:DNA-binding NtrC family response regulator
MSQGKILIVDDEIAICNNLCNLLASEGYDVDYRLNAIEALAIIKQRKDLDVVITDITMPGIDGIIFLKEVKQIENMLPVIIITAYATEENIAKTFRLHAYEFIVKPFDAAKMYFVVKQAVLYHAMLKKFKNK